MTTTAIEKIIHVAETVAAEKGDAEAFATKLRRSARKGDIEILHTNGQSLTVSTNEGEVYRINQGNDSGFAAFAQFMGRKSSVLLPKLKKVGEESGWIIYQTEDLESLEAVVGPELAQAFYNWAIQYITTRDEGKRATRGMEHKAPDMDGLVNYGNLRGLLNKLINHAHDAGVDLNTKEPDTLFKVRDRQLVIAEPMAA